MRRAKARGIDVTCEVNHWAPFLSTWDDVTTLGPYALSYWVPDEGREAVWAGLRDGTIDMISSDHAPHTREEKEVGWKTMWSSHTGTPGIQYYYPLLLDAVRKGELTLERAVDAAPLAAGRGVRPRPGQGPDRRRLRRRHGDRRPGHAVDHHQRRRAVQDRLDLLRRPRGRRADIDATFVRGEPVFADGTVVGEPGHGRMATGTRSTAAEPLPPTDPPSDTYRKTRTRHEVRIAAAALR